MRPKSAVLKIGGHLVHPVEGVDPHYVARLVEALKACKREIKSLAVVVGGGVVARRYIEVARTLGVGEGGCDSIGILASRLNAALLSAAFWKGLPPPIPTTLESAISQVRSLGIAFMGGLQPGQSTTTVAALVAEALPADLLVIATDVEGVYTADPKLDPSARLLERVSIGQLRSMFSKLSGAGGYKLLDPYTLEIMERSKIRAVVISGKDPENIVRAVRGEKIGTLIET